MRSTTSAVVLAAASFALCAAPAGARPTVTTTFNEGFNAPGWHYGGPGDAVVPSGGNPHWYLRSAGIDTFAPQPRSGVGVQSEWTGNYRARNVQRIGVDLATFAVDFSAGGRPLSLILVSDNATPADPDDDWGAYLVGAENIPVPGEGWKTFVFDIPVRETALPGAWRTIQFGPGSPANPDWNALLQNVSQVRFFYGDPDFFFIFQMWTVGLDNALVRYCPGDTNGDGVTNFAELNAVLSAFGQVNTPPAPLSPGDINGDGVVNFADLNLVLSRFGQAC